MDRWFQFLEYACQKSKLLILKPKNDWITCVTYKFQLSRIRACSRRAVTDCQNVGTILQLSRNVRRVNSEKLIVTRRWNLNCKKLIPKEYITMCMTICSSKPSRGRHLCNQKLTWWYQLQTWDQRLKKKKEKKWTYSSHWCNHILSPRWSDNIRWESYSIKVISFQQILQNEFSQQRQNFILVYFPKLKLKKKETKNQ